MPTWTNPTAYATGILYPATEDTIRVNDIQWLHDVRFETLAYDHTYTAWNNDSATKTVLTYAVPAGTLSTSNPIFVRAWFKIKVTTANNNQLTVGLSYGGSNIATGGTSISANSSSILLELQAALLAAGATNAQDGHCLIAGQTIAAAGWTNTALPNQSYASASIAVDSTASQNLVLSISQSRANADATLYYYMAIVYRYPT
jgi:hypothetical protein